MRHKNLASERIRIGYNQSDLAESLGTTVKMVVKYEADADTMPADFVKRAAELFGCTADYLLDMTDERTGRAVYAQEATR